MARRDRNRRGIRSGRYPAERCSRAARVATVATLAWAAAALMGPRAATAHPLAPALLELRERGGGTVEVRWKTSLWRPSGGAITPEFPRACVATAQPSIEPDATGRSERWILRCNRSLAGTEVAVAGLAESGTNAIVRVYLDDGRLLHAILDAREPRWTIPERASARATFRAYANLGVEHIATGFDHLLFVFGLMLLVRDARALVATVTAFTVGHSVTLALAVLGYARAPAGPIELLIALTILALAVELAKGPQHTSWARRRPWLMAGGFGLLHGLGFADALREVGLPEGDLALALAAFNLGIETGQLAFIALVAIVGWALTPLRAPVTRSLARAPIYLMGTLAAYWTIDRAADLWR